MSDDPHAPTPDLDRLTTFLAWIVVVFGVCAAVWAIAFLLLAIAGGPVAGR